jgi:hypothetical protein
LAKDYAKEIDFAFFAVNFHYSKDDYDALTIREKLFIYKAWEEKIVSQTTHLRNAVFNAMVNANRKKNSKWIELWKKKQKQLNKETVEGNLNIVKETDKKEGPSWIEKVYEANGLKIEERRKEYG